MIKLDELSIEDLFLSISERPPIPTPEQDVEHVQIKGRHGTVTKKYGYKVIDYPLTFNFLEDTSFKQAFRKAKIVFMNTKQLSFDDDPDIFYKVKSVKFDTASNDVLEFGQFSVTFTLDPFAYEATEMITVLDQTTFKNPGYDSEPYIKCYINGSGNIYIGNQVVTITNINGFIELDSSLMNAYKIENGLTTNLNDHMVGDFLLFPQGDSLVRFDGNITKLEIDPRWRWI
jgi:predicted phage tail component-like protein